MIFNLSDKAADFYICSRFACALMHAFPPLSPCYFYFNIFCIQLPLKVIIASSSRPRKEYNKCINIIQQLPLSSDTILVAGGAFWWLWVRSWWDGQVRFNNSSSVALNCTDVANPKIVACSIFHQSQEAITQESGQTHP